MRVQFPPPSGGYTSAILGQFFATIARALGRCLSKDEPLTRKSPDGTSWVISITDGGQIVTTPE